MPCSALTHIPHPRATRLPPSRAASRHPGSAPTLWPRRPRRLLQRYGGLDARGGEAGRGRHLPACRLQRRHLWQQRERPFDGVVPHPPRVVAPPAPRRAVPAREPLGSRIWFDFVKVREGGQGLVGRKGGQSACSAGRSACSAGCGWTVSNSLKALLGGPKLLHSTAATAQGALPGLEPQHHKAQTFTPPASRPPVPVGVEDDVLAAVAVPKGVVLQGRALPVGQALHSRRSRRSVAASAWERWRRVCARGARPCSGCGMASSAWNGVVYACTPGPAAGSGS